MKKPILIGLMAIFTLISHAQTNIIQLEYAIDTDDGVGANTLLTIAAGADITASIVADMPASIANGNHKVFIRTKDDNGRWSHTTRTNIHIVALQSQNNIVMAEYALDNDPSYGVATTFSINPQEEDILQAFLAQIPSDTPIGYHKLYGRVKDTYGNWSQSFRRNIQVVDDESPTVLEIEYFFENDPEFANATIVAIDNPQADGSWTFEVPYPPGPYDFNDVLYVRVKDTNSRWSHTSILDRIDPNLSIGQVTDNSLVTVFPNPFSEKVQFKIPDHIDLQGLSIYNLSGQVLLRSKQVNHSIALSELSSGMYLLKLDTNQGSSTYKIVKQ